MSNNAYSAVIADLKSKRDELNRMIKSLEQMSGIMTDAETSSTGGVSIDIPSDADSGSNEEKNDFLGKSIPDATLILLRKERRKMKTKEIAKSLQDGGMEFSSASVTNTIGSVLNRRQSKVGDIVSPDRGYWGLKEWYPGRTFGKKAKEDEKESETVAPNQTSEPEQLSSQENVVPIAKADLF